VLQIQRTGVENTMHINTQVMVLFICISGLYEEASRVKLHINTQEMLSFICISGQEEEVSRAKLHINA
jgi:hypothetical protein